jgi:hypothetical protein
LTGLASVRSPLAPEGSAACNAQFNIIQLYILADYYDTLLRKLPNPKLADQKLEWRQNAGLRGLTKLTIGFDS